MVTIEAKVSFYYKSQSKYITTEVAEALGYGYYRILLLNMYYECIKCRYVEIVLVLIKRAIITIVVLRIQCSVFS